MSVSFERWEPGSDWEDHPYYGPGDWIEAVCDGETRDGYVDWVNKQLRNNAIDKDQGLT